MISASRVGRKPITIPTGVDIKIQAQEIAIKGPKGHLTLAVHPHVQVVVDGKVIKIEANTTEQYSRKGTGSKLKKAISGTVRSDLNNAVHGVSVGFERKLVLVGVGYRAAVKGQVLALTLGYSHPVEVIAPNGIIIETPSATEIIVKGVDKHLVGHIASIIRSKRSPEPYKGKGIRYFNENIIRKETKKK